MEEQVASKLEEFFTKFKQQSYKKGDILIRAGEEPSGIFYLKEGTVKEYAISIKGDELIINIFRPVSFFPMLWAINNTPNIYYFEAMTDLEVWKAPKTDVIKFIKNEPDVLYNLLSRVFKGLDGMMSRMTYLMAGNAHSRLIAEIIIQAKRFGRHKSAPPFGEVELTISETDLAAQTGMSRETVSREIKILKNKNLVSFSKNILTIQDLNKLEVELESL